MNLSYINEKIKNAEFSEFPFKHVEINDFFKKQDFQELMESPEITTNCAKDDEALFNELFANNYKIMSFPGCTENYKEYIEWHKEKKSSQKTNTSCKGYGVVLRLESAKSEAINSLQKFLHSRDFIECIAQKFGIKTEDCKYDSGIQKYLDGYEISPHPDIRMKALTFMVNINPNPDSFDVEYCTSYLQLKPEWNYVREFWKGNKKVERCWVPWNWCEVKKQQRKNNSIVLFSPDDDTIHAVRADYNHLAYQRTQLYGNLWYNESQALTKLEWENIAINVNPKPTVKESVRKIMPNKLVTALKNFKGIFTKSTHFKKKY